MTAAASVAVVLGILFVLRQIERHPVLFATGGLVLLVGAALFAGLWHRGRRAEAALRAERDQRIAVTDGMSGHDFEHWVARLLRRSGCADVRVVGGAGDAGADVVALSPAGSRVVVQCKRYDHVNRKVGSKEVQLFTGTAWFVHHAQIALMVTTTRYTKPAAEVAARARITLVDRDLLAEWARSGTAPPAVGLH
ncbi:restriction endonuclease [Actinokineospora sp. NBRC 105648]|uniref:restriction endonuclease n=1 Tax=Actinokineospora sp. NBRC 105648 TaxID=3032206 RepID=UPI0024A0ED46|nr:restriction endonuclease [Actinokineospora sp. NBRC 105648]GLZ36876.1 hypothetical protein Acsp05_05010 [Actinokineospora sp. NBRC 105648]